MADENLLVLAGLIEQNIPDGRSIAHLDCTSHIIARSTGKMRRTLDRKACYGRDHIEMPIASLLEANRTSGSHAADMRADAKPWAPVAHKHQIHARLNSRDKDIMHFRSNSVVKTLNPAIFKAPHIRLATSQRMQPDATLSRRDLRQIVADMID